jgi:hypothetical protein
VSFKNLSKQNDQKILLTDILEENRQGIFQQKSNESNKAINKQKIETDVKDTTPAKSLIEKPPNIENKQVNKNPEDSVLSKLQRIVHIDLKGAPPKSSYFEKFIPFLKQNGAHGILLEYEDMFPFEGQLKEARHGLAYTLKEVEQINKLAKDNGLYVIPLVQTYGHLEWLLKVKKFAHLRENSEYPQVITPCLAESYNVLFGKLYLDNIVSHLTMFYLLNEKYKKICSIKSFNNIKMRLTFTLDVTRSITN